MSELPAWLRETNKLAPAAPAGSAIPDDASNGAVNPAAAWLAPDDRAHPEPGELDPAIAKQLGDRASMTGAEATALAKGWAGPTVGERIPGSVDPNPAPAPIREPGEEQQEPGQEQEPEKGDPRIDTITEGLLLFKRLWLWPAGTQNELEAAREFASFIVEIVKEHKINGTQS